VRRLSFIPLLVMLAVLCTALPSAARAPIAIGISDPRGGNLAVLDQHIKQVGVKPALWALWSNWGSRGGSGVCRATAGSCSFPSATANELLKRGITPVIWWQPVDPARPANRRYNSFKRIAQGKHDAYIFAWAKALRQVSKNNGNRSVVVRFAHEASGNWFPWSIGKAGNTVKNYKAAWRRIDRIFRQAGARNNTKFLWSNLMPSRRHYPGDRYVDYIGATVMNYGKARQWRSMNKVVTKVVSRARKFSRKPIFLAEVGSSHRGGNKAGWIRTGYLQVYKRFPQVRAIMYLDSNAPALRVKHPDWRLAKASGPSAVAAYRAIAKSPKFRGRIR